MFPSMLPYVPAVWNIVEMLLHAMRIFNMREQCSLMLHRQSQARAFLFTNTKERHLHIQFKRPLGRNMVEEEKERRKKKGKTRFNQVFSQSIVD